MLPVFFDQIEEHNTTPPPTAYPLCPASPTNPHRP